MGHWAGAFEGRRWAAHGAPLLGRQPSTRVCSRQWLSIFSAHRTFFRRSLKDSCFWPTESLCYQSGCPWPFWAVLTSEWLSPAVVSCYHTQTWGAASPYLRFPKLSCTWGSFLLLVSYQGGFLRSENLSQGLIPHQGTLGGFTPPRAGGTQGSCTCL